MFQACMNDAGCWMYPDILQDFLI